MNVNNLTEKEENILVLKIISEILVQTEATNMPFEEYLHEEVFVNNPYMDLIEMICKTIVRLHEEKMIIGEVKLEYETVDDDDFNETITDNIDLMESVFDVIDISNKGKLYLENVELVNMLSNKIKSTIQNMDIKILPLVVEYAFKYFIELL